VAERIEAAPEIRREASVAAVETPPLVRRPRAGLASQHSGGVGGPPGDNKVPCQGLADGGWSVLRTTAVCSPNKGTAQRPRGSRSATKSAARRRDKNAAMERRKARRLREKAHSTKMDASIGAPSPSVCQRGEAK